MLGNSDEHRLMVSRGVDGSHAVDTGIETVSDIDSDNAIDLRSVDTLEEGEDVRVSRGRLVKRGELLNRDVGVADDVTLCIHSLRSRVVVAGSVNEVTSLEVVERHGDGELLVRWNGVAVLG